jgi:hypothetical protein
VRTQGGVRKLVIFRALHCVWKERQMFVSEVKSIRANDGYEPRMTAIMDAEF